MNHQPELQRYLTIFALAAPSAVIVWFVFHGVYESLTQSVRVVGYVEPLTQAGIYAGYFVMVGGTLVLAAIAAWSALACIRLLLQRRR